MKEDLAPFLYRSAIRGESPGFTRLGEAVERGVSFLRLAEGSLTLSLRADQQHTITVAKGVAAAWLVVEGEEDANYVPVTWSNDDLERFDFSGMYRSMTSSECEEMLAKYELNNVLSVRIKENR